MKVTYLGTGAAEGIPALFCQCEYCRAARARGEIRSRSQVLFDGELSVDFPPDAFMHSARKGTDFSAIRYLLVTHSHMDHFFAGDLVLRGYKYAQNMTVPDLTILSNAETQEIFREVTRRELRQDVAERLHLLILKYFEITKFGGWTVLPLKAKHSSSEPMVFLLEKEGKRILHLHDTALLPEEDFACLEKLGGNACDLITLDCTFLWNRGGENARHMGLYENEKLIKRLESFGFADGHTVKVITHFSHSGRPDPDALRRAEETFGVIAAFDGMELTI